MNKQSTSILLNRVGLSIFLGMIMLLVACQELSLSVWSNNSDTPTPPPEKSTPPTPPTLVSAKPNDDGGTVIEFTESSDVFKHTLITATSIGGENHTVTATVPRGIMYSTTGTVTLYGLKENKKYSITL